MNFDLSERVAIITGAGSGIGRAMALSFAEVGAKIVVQDVVAERVDEVVAEIQAAGGKATGAVADISDEEAVGSFVAEVMKEWGRIDILCNNAGIGDRLELPLDTSTEHWNRMIAINLTAQFFVTRAVLAHMVKARSGAIINTSSEAGLRGGAASCSYTVSKHGMIGLTRSIAWIHREDGIRCNAICPGNTPTGMGGKSRDTLDQDGLEVLLPVLRLSKLASGPELIANAALFLASDASSFITGAVIPVDGGWSVG
jgi:NAD(P)-dependent dehydrogenase (short-subunit alcohol dehydrogenase family)